VSLAGLILAAGASRRMGFPKPLLELEGETFLDRLIAAFLPSCDPVIVVLGHHGERIRRGIRRAADVQFVENPDPERGMLSSLRCGLRAAPAPAGGVIFTPADYPRILPSTVAQLAEAFSNSSGGNLVFVPVCDGRRGHPVCIARPLFPEFLDLPDDADPRTVIRRHRPETAYVEAGDPGILKDIDLPEDYRRLVGPD